MDQLILTLDHIISTLALGNIQTNNPTIQIDNQTRIAVQIIDSILSYQIVPKPMLPPPATIPVSLPLPISSKIKDHNNQIKSKKSLHKL